MLGVDNIVDLSSSLKALTTKKYQLTSRERLLVIALIAAMIFLFTTYLVPAEEVIPPLPKVTSQNPVAKKNLPVASQVAEVNPTKPPIRDPFALPPEDKIPPSGAVPLLQNNVPSMVPKNTGAMETLLLTGTIGSGEQSMAVIKFNGKSKSYRTTEFIGIYQLAEIQKDSVVLTSSTGNLVLHLEPPKQKEGNRSEK